MNRRVWSKFAAPRSRSKRWPPYCAIEEMAPPTPDMAIEEAKLVRADLEAQSVQRDQLERSTNN